jgi:hypothetical protein
MATRRPSSARRAPTPDVTTEAVGAAHATRFIGDLRRIAPLQDESLFLIFSN